MSTPVFATSIEATRNRAKDIDEIGSQKVARFKELRSRLSPVRVSSSLPCLLLLILFPERTWLVRARLRPLLLLMLSTSSLLNFFPLDQSQSIRLKPL